MISVGFKTDKGRQRGGNEDSLFILPEQQLYIVADGVGGHNSGELASRLAVGYIAQYVAINQFSAIRNERELKRYLKTCIEGANELVYGKAVGENQGMATTTVICCIRGEKAYVVNVGDSRAYLLRDGILRQITRDHTLIQEMIDNELISPEDAENHPDKHMITRAVGGDAKIRADFFNFEIYPKDIIIMCTDGLYGETGDRMIAQIAAGAQTMHGLATELVEAANRHGGRDNISVVCIKIQ